MPFLLSQDEFNKISRFLISSELYGYYYPNKPALTVEQVQNAIQQSYLRAEYQVQVEVEKYEADISAIISTIQYLESQRRKQIAELNQGESVGRQAIETEEQAGYLELKHQAENLRDLTFEPKVKMYEQILLEKFNLTFADLVSKRADLFYKPGINAKHIRPLNTDHLGFAIKSILLKNAIEKLQREYFNAEVAKILENCGPYSDDGASVSKVSAIINEVLTDSNIDLKAKSEQIAQKLQSQEVQQELQKCSKSVLKSFGELVAWLLSFGCYVPSKNSSSELSRTISTVQDLCTDAASAAGVSTAQYFKMQSGVVQRGHQSSSKVARVVGFARSAKEEYRAARNAGDGKRKSVAHVLGITAVA